MTGWEQPLAAVLALAGSACYAVAAVTQQRIAARLPSKRAFDPIVLVRLARRPAWLAALALVIAGFAMQAVALALGRLVVIEPMLATGLVFALALAARRDRRRLRPGEWAAAVAVVAGLSVFLVAGHPAGGQRTAGAMALGLAAAAAIGMIGVCTTLALRCRSSHRALLLGVGGGVAAGVTDALIKTVTVLAVGHVLALFGDVRLYLLMVVGVLTYTIQQNGYRAAGLAAFLPAFAVLEPVTGSLLGLVIYHERLSDGPGQVVVELAACAAAAWGIAWLARSETANGTQPIAGAQPAGDERPVSGSQPDPGPVSPGRPGPAVPADSPAVPAVLAGSPAVSATSPAVSAVSPADSAGPAIPAVSPAVSAASPVPPASSAVLAGGSATPAGGPAGPGM
jgi:drug/metabolite transporter (DMT)-like permease